MRLVNADAGITVEVHRARRRGHANGPQREGIELTITDANHEHATVFISNGRTAPQIDAIGTSQNMTWMRRHWNEVQA